MKSAGSDEQDVIGPHHPVLRVHRGAFDDRQDVALHAFATHFGAVTALAAGDLVDFVDEDDPRLLDALDRGRRHRLHVDELLLLFLRQALTRLGDGDATPLRAALEQPGNHLAQADADVLHRRAGDQLDRRKRFFLNVDLDHPLVEPAVAQLLADPLAGRIHLVADPAGILVRRRRSWRQQQIEQALLGILLGVGANFFERSSRTMPTASSTRSRTIDSTSRPT